MEPHGALPSPSLTRQWRKTTTKESKTDFDDAAMIADFARRGKIKRDMWRGGRRLAPQRLARRRLRVVERAGREKSHMISNIYLKFSELAVDRDEENPFKSRFGVTALEVVNRLTPGEIASKPLEELTDFVNEHGRGSFADPKATAELLKKAAANSYRLDKPMPGLSPSLSPHP
jgi:hypothetical protein